MTEIDRARAAGQALAARHRATGPAEPDPAVSVLNYAEMGRTGDWSLRSAMVRLALPEPMIVVEVANHIRRLDTVLHHVATPLAKQTVSCDRAISLGTVDGEPIDPYPDTRIADVARLAASAGPVGDVVVESYVGEVELTQEERVALPLVGVALQLDSLAELLADWAITAPATPPVADVRAAAAAVKARMDELGVPVEDGGPPRGRGRRG